MPATARRSKSEAYEEGIREGAAMARRSRSVEPPEEEEEEEMDMAMQPGHSRKRSARGAKNTKPAADGYGMKKPMDAECGCSGKKGGKCDGNCGGSMKRDSADVLTPQEYLAACDLGIQSRSRNYIRARLDAAARLDLKCGKGSISEGEKCTKGAAQRVQPQQPSRGRSGGSKVRGLKTAAKIAGAAALIGGAAYMQQTARRNIMERRSLANPMSTAGVAFKAQTLRENMSPKTVRSLRERAAMNAAARRSTKRDSVYASGFSSVPETYDI